MRRMTASLREERLEVTLARARTLAPRLGITRVTDTTWLDRIGIPVYASIRPSAVPGSLCVNAGKGVRPLEAQVGAFMEAIEFAASEYRRYPHALCMMTPRHLVEQSECAFVFVDLCPVFGAAVDPDADIACVQVEDLFNGGTMFLPAELIFSPFSENPAQEIFGTSTNGLCSGNSLSEASIHGICELMERHVQALNFVSEGSVYVDIDNYDDQFESLKSSVVNAGLELAVRYTPNEFCLPYFEAFILEPSDGEAIAISRGSGLHPIREIAATRAITEAAQSRLSYIHGGRDDLILRTRFFAGRDAREELDATAKMRTRVLDRSAIVSLKDTHTIDLDFSSANSVLAYLRSTLKSVGCNQIFHAVLSDKQWPVCVIKVIVPGLESFQPTMKRAGPRLRDHVLATEVTP